MAKSEVINADRLIKKLYDLQDKVFPQAVARAVHRVSMTVVSRTVKDIAGATGLTQKTVRRRVVLAKKASVNDPEAIIRITGRPLNLIEFKANPKTVADSRERKRGVRASPWGKRRHFREAFVARMPNGSVIVVRRDKSGKKIQKGPNKGSPAIKAMWGPGIASEAANVSLKKRRDEVVKERMEIELRHELRYRVARLLIR
jgi:hypothetical protein